MSVRFAQESEINLSSPAANKFLVVVQMVEMERHMSTVLFA